MSIGVSAGWVKTFQYISFVTFKRNNFLNFCMCNIHGIPSTDDAHWCFVQPQRSNPVQHLPSVLLGNLIYFWAVFLYIHVFNRLSFGVKRGYISVSISSQLPCLRGICKFIPPSPSPIYNLAMLIFYNINHSIS